MDKNSIVRLALDIRHENVPVEYANQNPSDVLRQALIELNGGSSEFNYKTLRRNKTEIFEIIEEILPVLIQEGLKGDEFWNNLVETRNLALGDKNEFWTEDNSLFVVSRMADGIATPRRQRIGEKTSVSVDTAVRGIRIFDELSRFLSGRIDWNDMISRVAKSYTAQLRDDVFSVFNGLSAATPGLNSTYVVSGTYNEEKLLELVDHVEAATGATATLYGTKPALRKVTSAVMSDSAKDDYYNAGFFGKVAGVNMVAIQNRHKVGTDTFIIPNDKIWVIAGEQKPILHVTEGDAYVVEKDATANADMTMEYTYITREGLALLVRNRMGIYTITT